MTENDQGTIVLEKVGSDIKHIFPDWTTSVAKEYAFTKKLGKGGFGEVYLCKRNSDKRVLACKVMNKTAFSKSTLQSFHDEVTLMNTLKHPGIVEFVTGFETKKKLYLIMESCNGGELYAKIIAKNKISEKDCVSWTKQILEVLKYCHGRQVLHCDLKPENVLFTDDTGTIIKVIDFGLAKIRRRHEWTSKVGGTPMYIAPECLDRHYSEVCDIWAVGVMVFEMLHGYLPFMVHSNNPKAPIMLAKKGLKPPSKLKGPNINLKFKLSKHAVDFITHLIVVDPAKRPDAAEALLHPWLIDGNASEEQLTYVLTAFKARKALSGVQKFMKNMIHSTDVQSWIIDDVKKVFAEADADSDGHLSWDEFKGALTHLSKGMSDEEAKKLFDVIDTDHDKTISIDEFISEFTFEHAVKHDDAMWEMCKELDQSGSSDNKITKEDVDAFIKKNPKFKESMDDDMKQGMDALFKKGAISYDQLICAMAP